MDHPITLRELTVLRVVDVTPGIRRVTLGGPQLGPLVRDGFACPEFVTAAADDHVKIFPPTDGPLVLPTQDDGHLDWPDDGPPVVHRDYTVRRYDAGAQELDLDVVLGHDGPGAHWATTTKVGDPLHIAGPRQSLELPLDAPAYVLVGDEAALPAMARFGDELPAERIVAVAIAHERDRTYPLCAGSVVWITPADGAESAEVVAAVGDALAAHPDAYVWAGLEFQAARDLRVLLRERGVDRSRSYVTHYWRRDVEDPAEVRAASEAAVRAMADVVTPTVLRVAVTLGLPDAVAAGADTVEAVAGATGCDAGAVGIVLAFLAEKGVVRLSPSGQVALTPVGERLRRDDDSGLHHGLRLDTAFGHMTTALPGLRHAVETGASAYEHVHGRSFWTALADDPDLGASFDRQLGGWADQWAPAVAGLDVWPASGRVLDVAGGKGALAAAVAVARPDASVTVLELDGVAARARVALAERGVGERVEVVGGSFFEPLPEADRVVLAQVLHDWPDEDAARIVARCAAALPPDGRLLVVERLTDGVAAGGEHAAMGLLMLSLFGARERSRHDYEQLLAAAGLEVVAVHETGTALSVIEARPLSR